MPAITIQTPKGERTIGPGQPCFVIAEASSNHGNDLVRAKKLIDMATTAGADAVKFQIFSAETNPLPKLKRNIPIMKTKNIFFILPKFPHLFFYN